MNPKKDTEFSVDTGRVSDLLSGLSGRFGTETAGHSSDDGTTADRSNGKTASRHNGTTAPAQEPAQEPAPAPAARSKYTLLLDQDDALTLDQLALDLRRRTGRPIDKSEILRALIRLADTHPATAHALGAALDRRTTPGETSPHDG
ncbi:hypothetical protein [Streptomyces sp. URMC 125]|uniref:hypothetical protein n=1 Tax=Streptomyces sp. URMC 125 TaxID=3423419 RepID=UPI003F1BCD11